MKFPPEKVTHLNAVERREMAEVKFWHDAGGNAEKFQGSNAEEGLLRLTSLWSKAWKEQGQNILWSGKGSCDRLPSISTTCNYRPTTSGVIHPKHKTLVWGPVGSQTHEIISVHQEKPRNHLARPSIERFPALFDRYGSAGVETEPAARPPTMASARRCTCWLLDTICHLVS